MLAVRFKDGTTDTCPIKAASADGALDQVDSYLHKFEGKKEVKEINILAGGKDGGLVDAFKGTYNDLKSSGVGQIASGFAKGAFSSPPPPTAENTMKTPSDFKTPSSPKQSAADMGQTLGNFIRKQIEKTPERIGKAQSWEQRQREKYEYSKNPEAAKLARKSKKQLRQGARQSKD